jgi:hypothetical protein
MEEINPMNKDPKLFLHKVIMYLMRIHTWHCTLTNNYLMPRCPHASVYSFSNCTVPRNSESWE